MIRRIFASLVGVLVSCTAAAFVVSPPVTVSAPGGASPYELGFDAGFAKGFGEGLSTGVSRCVANPAACGIAVKSSTTPLTATAKYGETEPNDNIVTANPLVANADFYGQSYGTEDRDWFYLVTPRQNYTLTINFALADIAAGNLSGWRVSVRNAVGMSFAAFDTGLTMVADTSKGLYYTVTLGLAGTYYIVVEPVANAYTQQRYRLRASLEPAANTNQNFVVNFYDAENEPNNTPPNANRITPGVTMYGLINLSFDNPHGIIVEDGKQKQVWLQGESDWFVYKSEKGREIVQLSFCDRQPCGPGNWLVQFYDQTLVDAVMKAPEKFQDNYGNPFDPFDAAALVTFNTTSCGKDPCATTSGTATDQTPEVWHLGIDNPGTYYIRVGHKRKFDAPCAGYETLTNPPNFCTCEEGKPSCATKIFNPNAHQIAISIYPRCPNGTGGGEEPFCEAQCLGGEITGHVDMDGNGIADGAICGCPDGKFPCKVKVKNPGEPTPWSAVQYPVCPNGKDGFENNRLCPVQCLSARGPGLMDLDGDGLPGAYCTCPGGTYPCTNFTNADGTTNAVGNNKSCFMTSGMLDLDGNNLPDTGGVPDTGSTSGDITRYACYCPEGKYPCTVTDAQTQKEARCLAAKPGTQGTVADGLNAIACSCAGAMSPGSDVGYPCTVTNPADNNRVQCLTEYPGQMDIDGDGLPEMRPCDCSGNKFPCVVTTPNPSKPVSTTEPQYPICPNGDKIVVELGPDYGPELCTVDCIADNRKGQIDFNFDGLPDTELGRCDCADGGFPCQLKVPNPGTPTPSTGYVFGACPDGSAGENDGAQCTVGCQCVRFSGMVEVPEGNISSQYNFTWMVNPKGASTQGQVESTINTDAYRDFLNRPSAY